MIFIHSISMPAGRKSYEASHLIIWFNKYLKRFMSNEMKLRKHKRKAFFFPVDKLFVWLFFPLFWNVFKPQKSENKNNEKLLSFFFSFYLLLLEFQLLVCLLAWFLRLLMWLQSCLLLNYNLVPISYDLWKFVN